MRLVKGIVSNEGIINDVVIQVTPKILTTIETSIKENLGSFIEDLADTFESIAAFAQESMSNFIYNISTVLGSKELTQEQKIENINLIISGATE